MDESSIQQRAIGVFDSGIGGLTVANAIHSRMSNESLYYFGDTAHIPYGTQPASSVLQYCLEISQFLLDQSCKAIVVACNTATAAALPQLRSTWPAIPFVGMEPAVKPAARTTQSGKIGVLATQTTFRSTRYQSLLEKYAQDYQCFEDPCIGLVELIESGKWNSPQTEQLLQAIIDPMLREGVDTLVLGCTHYPFVKPLIQRIAGPDVTIIDPAPAIAKQLESILQREKLRRVSTLPPDLFFWTSGEQEAMKKALPHLGFQNGNIYRFQSQ